MKNAEALNEGLKKYQALRASGEFKPLNPQEKSEQNPRSLRLAINAKCWDCVCYQRKEVTLCEMTDCSLWALRPWQNKEINKQILEAK